MDASALVKLLLNDPKEKGTENIQEYFIKGTSFYTTSLCFAETLGVLKRKYSKEKTICRPQYLNASEKLLVLIFGKKIIIEEVPIAQPSSFKEAKRLIEKYKIDLADAMQIVSVMRGKFSVLTGGSKTILITADKELAKAASKESVRVWNCETEGQPV